MCLRPQRRAFSAVLQVETVHPEIFFAPRAVRPNSAVTIEQKKDHSPFQANHNDRSRSGRPHSPQPGMQSSSRQETKSEANNKTQTRTARNGEYNGQSQLYKNQIKSKSRTQRQQGIDPATDRNQSKKSQLTGKKRRSQSP